jgi:PAS domain S-box-containing protein
MYTDTTHLTSLFEFATEGIILTGEDGQIQLVNPAAQQMFGYSESELAGQRIEVLIPLAARGRHKNLREDFYHHPSNRVMGHGRDLYGQCKNGSQLPVEVSLSFYRKEGQLFVIAFIVDITQRKKTEENIQEQKKQLEQMTLQMKKLNADLEIKVEERTLILKEALQKLEQSQKDLSEALDKERQLNEIKSRFVSMASHEFRTPLSTVLSSASLLTKYTRSEEQEKRDRHIEKIKNSVRHLNDILEDFLSLGKLDEGKVTVQARSFALGDLLSEILEEMRGLARPRQEIRLLSDKPVEIVSDPKLIKHIMINLVSNALKFSPEDRPVAIEFNQTGDRVVIQVQDHGIGIPEEDKPHLFSSFFRAGNATNIPGSGMGLHIVKRYVELLQGTIQVKSELGRGTCFSLNFPLSIHQNGNHTGH